MLPRVWLREQAHAGLGPHYYPTATCQVGPPWPRTSDCAHLLNGPGGDKRAEGPSSPLCSVTWTSCFPSLNL